MEEGKREERRLFLDAARPNKQTASRTIKIADIAALARRNGLVVGALVGVIAAAAAAGRCCRRRCLLRRALGRVVRRVGRRLRRVRRHCDGAWEGWKSVSEISGRNQ